MVTLQKIDDFCLNASETRRFPFELVYPLCFVDFTCTTYQGKYLYDDNCWISNNTYPTFGKDDPVLESDKHV